VSSGARVRNIREVEEAARELPPVATNAIRQMEPLIDLTVDPVEEVNFVFVDNDVPKAEIFCAGVSRKVHVGG